jgi:hypothetical protein
LDLAGLQTLMVAIPFFLLFPLMVGGTERVLEQQLDKMEALVEVAEQTPLAETVMSHL